MFDQTFLRHSMLGVNGSHKPFAEIVAFRDKHHDLSATLDACARYLGDSDLYSFGAIKYVTNLKNHYATRSMCWIKRWIYSSSV
mmetsp:Transcript_8081/g.28690  ORF Transcript_8081/g.28690 Transcript_8081/m.28690 type:complete len:84 (+) Transcript_8081:336-587(+)